MHHLAHWPLRRQIGLALAAATLLVSLLTGEMVRHFEKRYLENDLVLQTERVFATLSAASMDAVIARDRPVLSGLVEDIVHHDPDIVAFTITEPKGEPLVHWARDHPDAELRSFSKVLLFEGEKFGTMAVDWDISRRMRPIHFHVQRMRLLVFVSLLILSGAILGALDAFILRPIRTLSRRLVESTTHDVRQHSSRFVAREIAGLHEALSERLQTEEALRFTRFYIEQAGDPTFWLTEDGRFFYANQAAMTLLGCNRDQLGTLSVDQIFPAFRGDSWREFWAGLVSADTFTLDCRCRRMEGTEFPANTTINYLEYQGKAYCCMFVRDITDRRRAEEALRRAHDELEVRVLERTQELQQEVTERKAAEVAARQARETAEAANQAKSDFLATMSHEIRTPMNAVLGFANILLGTHLDEEQLDFVQTIRGSGESLLALINDILDFSKIEAGRLQLEVIPYDLVQVTEEVASLLSAKADEKKVDIAVHCDPLLPKNWMGDPIRLRQVLLNLLGNAIKFTERGHVFVEIVRQSTLPGQEGEYALFKVQDTGIGVAADKRHLLFQKFQQMDSSTTRKFGGTGLGLAICRLLVELMGGTIGMESEVGKGSTFWFTLPVNSAPGLQNPLLPTPELLLARVLVADPVEINRTVLRRQLAHWGIRHECAEDPAAAMAKLRSSAAFGEPFDIVLIDFAMAQKDGMAFVQETRREPLLRSTAFVLLAKGSQRSETTVFLARGFAATLLKPVVRQPALLDGLRKGWEQRRKFLAEPVVQPSTGSNASHVTVARPLGMPSASTVAAEAKRVSAPVSNKAKVLLAEDNMVNQKLARRLLENVGCLVTVALNGREAVDRAMLEAFDVVFMDCQMPELDGFEATQELRRLEQQGAIPRLKAGRLPIIALTANAVQGDRARCLAAGMDDYVSKPVSADDLRKAVEKWVPTSESSKSF